MNNGGASLKCAHIKISHMSLGKVSVSESKVQKKKHQFYVTSRFSNASSGLDKYHALDAVFKKHKYLTVCSYAIYKLRLCASEVLHTPDWLSIKEFTKSYTL